MESLDSASLAVPILAVAVRDGRRRLLAAVSAPGEATLSEFQREFEAFSMRVWIETTVVNRYAFDQPSPLTELYNVVVIHRFRFRERCVLEPNHQRSFRHRTTTTTRAIHFVAMIGSYRPRVVAVISVRRQRRPSGAVSGISIMLLQLAVYL